MSVLDVVAAREAAVKQPVTPSRKSTHVVSYSELDSIRQCRLKAHLAYKERWQPETISPALSRGKLFHSVLEAHYSALATTLGSSGVDQTVGPWDVLDAAEDCEETDTVKWIYKGYLDLYGEDKQWEVLAVEERVEEWLMLPNGRRSTFKLKGVVDLLVRDHSAGGGLWVVDHKTCRELPKQRALDFDDQMGIYTLLLRRAGYDIRGVIYNACRSYKLKRPMSPDERFKRHLTTRTEHELEVMAQEALTTFKTAYGVGQRGKVGGALPPRSPDPDRCGWRCPFTEACLMGRKGSDIRALLSETGFTQNFNRH
jgi:hypothetical protein